MTSREIRNIGSRLAALIDSRRLGDAAREIKAEARRRQAWQALERAERAEQAYAYMLRYVAEGVADPDRNAVYANIVNDLYSALDTLVDTLEKPENPSLYYSAIRTREACGSPGIEELLAKCEALADKMSIFSIVASGETTADEAGKRKEMEQAQASLFKAVWTSQALTAAEAEALAAMIEGDTMDAAFKTHVVSALTLGLMQRLDSRKLELLLAAYMRGGSLGVTSAALVGLLTALWMYRNRPLAKRVADRLAAAKDEAAWSSDLRVAFLELIRARDTERINRKIQDEVIPDMLNLRPELLNKISGGKINPQDITSLEENPEWQEMLDKNGITDKLKELTEIQMDGGDVMMSTFAHLKGFPFFSEISNWFLPFSISHSLVSASAERLGVVADMIEHAGFMCDNDKYSFMFAIDMVPKDQRDLMTSQFQAQSASIYEAMGEANGQTTPEMRKRAVNSYVQNIYRFFKLFNRRGEFFDPFDTGVNLTQVPALEADFDDPALLRVVAEFYFKLGYMRDALDIFDKIRDDGDDAATQASRLQKMGYCAEHMQNYALAIKHYTNASLLDAGSKWTAKRLAASLRAAGEKDRALQCYAKLAADYPDDLSIAMLYGYALIEMGRHAEAAKQFYKIEFLDEKSQKAWRPLAWTLFLTGDLSGSMKYYERIAASKPRPSDYLNMGHVALAQGDTRNAINYYKLSIEADGGSSEGFLKSLADDTPHLLQAGVDKALIAIVADAATMQ